jgi:hypothetical protein
MVLQSAALIARTKGVVSRLRPSLKSYKATFTILYDSFNEQLAQLLELAARWSPNYYTVAEIYMAFWAFLGIASPDCSGFKNQSHFFGLARSTYVGSPFKNTSRVGGGVEKNAISF